ncbi:hypothetical protein [Desulfoglaeba alkanexedens]|uniref:Uncharacterized protein n=1 Tax=Desulfoglaeba alkanexedens ALDC TaxID=980445 RepID=A0A4P8L3L6_9BACT|nr:hypothetical protein [Desulfoglaeba alkanexedens]QCQ21585.1 hypothetical protein FDQ92_04990 [Desulfoglaeba alkanexedens ALDC]
MKKMWIQLNPDYDLKGLEEKLKEIGRIERDPQDPSKIFLTFHNQSESGIKMSCFRLSEDFIHYFKDFDMVRS